MSTSSPRVLLVPDSIFWVTGVLARSFARYNPQIHFTVLSAPVLGHMLCADPTLCERFDLVHYLCPYASASGLERFSNSIPVVTSHHHVTDWTVVQHNVRGDAIVCGSTEWLNDIQERGITDGRAVLVPYGVDTRVFAPPALAERLKRKLELGLTTGPVIGFFGKKASNDDDRKGMDVLMSAVRRLSELEPGVSALLVGPGWRDSAAALRASGVRCTWIPFVDDHRQLTRYYAALDFYWVTARVEGGPVPLLEAMSCETCCLSTPVGIARDAIADGLNGVIIADGDPGTFAKVTSALWNDPSARLRIAEAARVAVKTSFDDSVTAPGIVEAYRRAEESFVARTGKMRWISWPERPHAGASREDISSVPADDLSSRERRLANRFELQEWGDRLSREGDDRRAAARVLGKAWLTHPSSFQMLRTYLRHSLPLPFVNRMASVRRALGRRGRE